MLGRVLILLLLLRSISISMGKKLDYQSLYWLS